MRGGKARTTLTVYSYNQAAAIARLARRSLERLIALGQGPQSLNYRRAGEAFLRPTFKIGSSVAVARHRPTERRSPLNP